MPAWHASSTLSNLGSVAGQASSYGATSNSDPSFNTVGKHHTGSYHHDSSNNPVHDGNDKALRLQNIQDYLGVRDDVSVKVNDPYASIAREHYDLPEAYHDNNGYTAQVLIERVKASHSEIITACAPWTLSNNMATWEFDIMFFHEHVLEREPEEAVPRLLTSSKARGRASMVRWGIAMMMEHGFYMTAEGARHYQFHMEQIRRAAVVTFGLNCMMTLVHHEKYQDPNDWRRNRNNGPRSWADCCTYISKETGEFAKLHKHRGGYSKTAREMQERLQGRPSANQSGGDVMIIPKGLRDRISETERDQIIRTKNVGDFDSNGARVIESQSYNLGEGIPLVDPIHSDAIVGERFWLSDIDKIDQYASPTDFRTAHLDIDIIDYRDKKIKTLSFRDLFTKVGIWDFKPKDNLHKFTAPYIQDFSREFFNDLKCYNWAQVANKHGRLPVILEQLNAITDPAKQIEFSNILTLMPVLQPTSGVSPLKKLQLDSIVSENPPTDREWSEDLWFQNVGNEMFVNLDDDKTYQNIQKQLVLVETLRPKQDVKRQNITGSRNYVSTTNSSVDQIISPLEPIRSTPSPQAGFEDLLRKSCVASEITNPDFATGLINELKSYCDELRSREIMNPQLEAQIYKTVSDSLSLITDKTASHLRHIVTISGVLSLIVFKAESRKCMTDAKSNQFIPATPFERKLTDLSEMDVDDHEKGCWRPDPNSFGSIRLLTTEFDQLEQFIPLNNDQLYMTLTRNNVALIQNPDITKQVNFPTGKANYQGIVHATRADYLLYSLIVSYIVRLMADGDQGELDALQTILTFSGRAATVEADGTVTAAEQPSHKLTLDKLNVVAKKKLKLLACQSSFGVVGSLSLFTEMARQWIIKIHDDPITVVNMDVLEADVVDNVNQIDTSFENRSNVYAPLKIDYQAVLTDDTNTWLGDTQQLYSDYCNTGKLGSQRRLVTSAISVSPPPIQDTAVQQMRRDRGVLTMEQRFVDVNDMEEEQENFHQSQMIPGVGAAFHASENPVVWNKEIILSLLKRARVSNGMFLKFCVDNNISPCFSLDVHRNAMTVSMSSIIRMYGGGACAKTHYRTPDVMVADNAALKMHYLHFNIYGKTNIMDYTKITINHNMVFHGMVSGLGTLVWDALDSMHTDAHQQGDAVCDMFVVYRSAAYDYDQFWWGTTTGRAPSYLDSGMDVSQAVYYPGCVGLCRLWGHDMNGDDSSETGINTLVVQGFQRGYNVYSGLNDKIITNRGHFGPKVDVNTADIINGDEFLFSEPSYSSSIVKLGRN
jgi:hypothetical protein